MESLGYIQELRRQYGSTKILHIGCRESKTKSDSRIGYTLRCILFWPLRKILTTNTDICGRFLKQTNKQVSMKKMFSGELVSNNKAFTRGILIKNTFDKVWELFEDNSIDMIHIDGLHTYDAVKMISISGEKS